MAVYKRQTISGVQAVQKPLVPPLLGGRIAKRSRAVAVMQAQDKTVGVSRRILAAQSLSGESSNDYDPGGAVAEMRVDVVWHSRVGSVSTVSTTTLVASQAANAGAPALPWSAVKLATISLIAPPNIMDVDDLAEWTEHIHAVITLSHVGGARVIDAVIEEVPHAVAREVDDLGDLWTSHLLAQGDPDGPQPQLSYPMQRLSETASDGDPRGGSWHLMDVANAQRLRLGPSLIDWTAFGQSEGGFGDDAYAETSSTSLARVHDLVVGEYDEDEPGWSISNYARGYAECHPHWSANNGSIPVLVAVYGQLDSTATNGAVRIQASDNSWVEVSVTSSTPQWWTGYGHLRCGVAPGDPSTVQALMRVVSGGGGNIRVQSICVYQMGNYAPAEL